MLLQTQVYGFFASGSRLGSGPSLDADGNAGQTGRRPSVHHVGLVESVS